MKNLFVVITVAALLSACSCNRKAEMEEKKSEAVYAVRDFGIDFFRRIALSEGYRDRNVVCSPVSASMMVSLLANSVSDTAVVQIKSLFGSYDVGVLNYLNAEITSVLPSLDPKVMLRFANSVWYDNNYTLVKDFTDVAKDSYGADIFRRDLSGNTPSVRNEIDSLVSASTNGEIRNLEIGMPAYGIIVSASCFQAEWMEMFDEKNTKKAVFHGAATDSEVNMMYRKGNYRHDVNEDCAYVILPFGAGNFTATFILPDGNIEEFLEKGKLNEVLSSRPDASEIELSLPKFKIAGDGEIDISDILYDMGVKSLASPATLHLFKEVPIAGRIVIYQKTSVEFNEKGAEASAVTDSEYLKSMCDEIVFNRPFIFFITEKSTKSILFAGKIMSL